MTDELEKLQRKGTKPDCCYGVRPLSDCQCEKDRLAALAATPAVGGEAIQWEDIARQLFAVDGCGFWEDRAPLQEEAYSIRAKAVAALYASPPASPLRGREILLALAKRHAEALAELGEAPIGKLSIDAISRNWLGGRVNGLAIALEIARAALSAAPPGQPAAEDEETEIELLAYRLAGAELDYRIAYEKCGGDSINTGRAWEKMRLGGDAIREYEADWY